MSVTLLILTSLSCSSNPNVIKSSDKATESAESLTVPPFKTKEPDTYSAERTITSSTANGEIVTREMIARNGSLRKTEIVSPNGPTTIYLENQSGKFLMLAQEKIYADITNEHSVSVATKEESEQLELAEDHVIRATTTPATYLKLGSEIIDGRNCTKWRVIVNTSDPKVVTNSETSIWIDDGLGMPVRSETISSNGSKTRMELTNVKTLVNAEQFSIPGEYHRVDPEILRKQLKNQ